MKTPIQIAYKYAKKCIRAYCAEGNQNLNWVIGTVRSSGVRGQELEAIFDWLREIKPIYAGHKQFTGYDQRLEQVYGEFKNLGWLSHSSRGWSK